MTLATILRAAALLLAATTAHADTTVGMHLGSWHSQPGYNNTNPGAYVRLDSGATLGAYRNSFRRTTVYLGKTWETEGQGLRLAVTAGACTGYDKPVLVVPSMSAPVGPARLRIAFIPKVEKGGAAVVHAAVETTF
jgi:hypothetical protein